MLFSATTYHSPPRNEQRARLPRVLGCLFSVAVLSLTSSVSAQALPVWNLQAASNSTVIPGDQLVYYITAFNAGDQPTDGITPITMLITLPPGITGLSTDGGWSCSDPSEATVVTCTSMDLVNAMDSAAPVILTAGVEPSASGVLTANVDISGGGAATTGKASASVRATTAKPTFGIDVFDGQVSSDGVGTPFTQAGGHPYSVSTTIDLSTTTHPMYGSIWPVEPVKDLLVDLPPGLVGNPTSVAQCTMEQLASPNFDQCPVDSQVGVATITVGFGAEGQPPGVLRDIAVRNMLPPPDVAARFGFNVAGTIVTFDVELRSATDYGLSVNVKGVSQGLAVSKAGLTFWGVPADPSHDTERYCPNPTPGQAQLIGCSTTSQRKPFLRNPTLCAPAGVGLPWLLRADSWFHPGVFDTATFVTHDAPGYPLARDAWGPAQGPTGCEFVPFDPTLTASPDGPARVGTPSGFNVELNVPQGEDPDAIGEGDIKEAIVTLPKGVQISPPSADGLAACSPEQIALHDARDPACPDVSTIGALTITTPLLAKPLTGAVYLATPFNNPFGSLIAIYLVAKGPGLVVKLPGEVRLDPVTGQVTTTVDNSPQVPFSNLHIAFKGGPRAPLSIATSCGKYVTRSSFTSWSGTTTTSEGSFEASFDGQGATCPPDTFGPEFSAGTRSPVAGAHSSFLLSLSRSDRDEEFRSLRVDMPRGLLATINGVALCPEAQAAAGTCSENSRIGSVTTGVGPGSSPFFLPGQVYLGGPYKGAPFSLSIVVPAVAGPFNLGTVVVRAAAQIDRRSAQLSVVSDPLPTMLQGIPLSVRVVRIVIDRPRFILNPTSCNENVIDGMVSSVTGANAQVASRFQVGNCANLPFEPRLALRVGGKGHIGPRASTPLRATYTQTPGQAGLKSVQVALPRSLNAKLDVVNRACTSAEFDTGNCARAKAGSAVAVTPLLAHPLRGGIYFVKTDKRGALPNLVVALRGQVDFDLVGKVTIPDGTRLATNFATPDIPIKKFILNFVSGRSGPLGVAQNLCTAESKRAAAAVTFRSQNGRIVHSKRRLQITGCPHKATNRHR